MVPISEHLRHEFLFKHLLQNSEGGHTIILQFLHSEIKKSPLVNASSKFNFLKPIQLMRWQLLTCYGLGQHLLYQLVFYRPLIEVAVQFL